MRIEELRNNILMMHSNYHQVIDSVNRVVDQHRDLFDTIIKQTHGPLILSRNDLVSLFQYGNSYELNNLYFLDSISIRTILYGRGIIGTFKFGDMNNVDIDYDGTCFSIPYPEAHSLQLIPELNISFIHNLGEVFYVMDVRTREIYCIDNINAKYNLTLPISLFEWTDDDLMILRLAYESNSGEEHG